MHHQYIADNSLTGGMFMSAKTGDNVVKAFYQIAGESVGIKLHSYELAFHDKVVTAYVTKDDDDDGDGDGTGRTAFADEIEAEDREAERRKREREASSSGANCQCALS